MEEGWRGDPAFPWRKFQVGSRSLTVSPLVFSCVCVEDGSFQCLYLYNIYNAKEKRLLKISF